MSGPFTTITVKQYQAMEDVIIAARAMKSVDGHPDPSDFNLARDRLYKAIIALDEMGRV